jgi:hypothetical protein
MTIDREKQHMSRMLNNIPSMLQTVSQMLSNGNSLNDKVFTIKVDGTRDILEHLGYRSFTWFRTLHGIKEGGVVSKPVYMERDIAARNERATQFNQWASTGMPARQAAALTGSTRGGLPRGQLRKEAGVAGVEVAEDEGEGSDSGDAGEASD